MKHIKYSELKATLMGAEAKSRHIKVKFERISNGGKAPPSYKCSNGMDIEHGQNTDCAGAKYVVFDAHGNAVNIFDRLADAKFFCLKNGE